MRIQRSLYAADAALSRYLDHLVRHALYQFWISSTHRCVLSSVGEPASLFVEVTTGDRVMHSQLVDDIEHAALVAEDLQKTFVKDSH